MKYDRTTLIKTALSVKAAWEQSYKDGHARQMANHKKALVEWETKHKADTVKSLSEALAAAKKGTPSDHSAYSLRSLYLPPAPPSPVDCCTPTTKKLDGLVEYLSTISDEDITANGLHAAGFKDMASVLRRPC